MEASTQAGRQGVQEKFPHVTWTSPAAWGLLRPLAAPCNHEQAGCGSNTFWAQHSSAFVAHPLTMGGPGAAAATQGSVAAQQE